MSGVGVFWGMKSLSIFEGWGSEWRLGWAWGFFLGFQGEATSGGVRGEGGGGKGVKEFEVPFWGFRLNPTRIS